VKLATLVLAVALATTAHAQAQAQTKKELVQKILQLQQPAVESIGKQLAEQPAGALLQRAVPAAHAAVPAERRDAVIKDIQLDVKKYADETVPLVRKRAVELAPTTVGPLIEERFSEDELKQLVALLESPVYRKYQQLGGEMQRALLEKLVNDTRPTVEPRVRALEQQVGQRLQAARAGAASAPASAGSSPSGAASRK
jgi:hypothetical protein